MHATPSKLLQGITLVALLYDQLLPAAAGDVLVHDTSLSCTGHGDGSLPAYRYSKFKHSQDFSTSNC